MTDTTKRPLATIILAAGESKRFRSRTPKVLHDLCGRPLLAYALDAAKAVRPRETVVVTGRAADRVEAEIGAHTSLRLTFARQRRLIGTADAARTGLAALPRGRRDVLIMPGDSPLMSPATLRALLARHRRTKAAATILTSRAPDPTGYGRIVREGRRVSAIVEHKDATPEQRAIDEVNSSVYVFERAALETALGKIGSDNAQGEYYLPDAIAVLAEAGERIEAVMAEDAAETMGVNDRAQLAEAAALLRARTNERLMAAGVTIIDPSQTYIEPTVRVKPDTVIHPMTFLSGSTSIGGGCQIGPGSRIADSKVGPGATVLFSEVREAVIGAEAAVGPYSFLRPGARLGPRTKVGAYVEVKNSVIGEGSKVPHLSYVGDAVIGKDVNIGAATVTVNYDGETKTKARTTIGDGAKIGSDTMLIAPVRIGKDAVTGAGSVVTKDVPAGTVVVGAPARKLRERRKG